MKSIFTIICLLGYVASQTVPVAKPEPSSKPVKVVVDKTQPTKVTKPTQKGCQPLCKTPLETCVRLARCQGNDCFQCAMTVSIVLPGTTKKTETKVSKPLILPANLVQANQQAQLQAILAAHQAQQAQQAPTTQSTQTGLFNSADPFQNMMFGSMMFDGGMGMF